ncbi:MAG: hypothetical protein LBE13_03490 [Bacteroidales bacterium]|jgi:hypothetical protein|nr:hypothetical protein [Bacteroidales bacterium]
MKKNILEQLFNDVLIEVYTNKNDTESFYAGKIKYLYKDAFILQSYNPKGLIDGYILIRNIDVFKISKETLYLKKLYILINNYNNIINSDLKLSKNIECDIDYIIKKCQQKHIFITIKLIYGDKLIGKILDYINNEYLYLDCVSEYGEKDGIYLIKYEDIENISFNGIDENIIPLIQNTINI